MQDETWAVGCGQGAPGWVRRAVTPYRRADGSTGLELWTKHNVSNVYPGDVLERKGDMIYVRRYSENDIEGAAAKAT